MADSNVTITFSTGEIMLVAAGDVVIEPLLAPVWVEVEAPPREVAHALRLGAYLIEAYGWRQGTFGSRLSGMCALGALNETMSMGVTHAAATQAAKALQRVVGNIPDWNDHDAPNAAYVIRTMRRVADELDLPAAIEAAPVRAELELVGGSTR